MNIEPVNFSVKLVAILCGVVEGTIEQCKMTEAEEGGPRMMGQSKMVSKRQIGRASCRERVLTTV